MTREKTLTIYKLVMNPRRAVFDLARRSRERAWLDRRGKTGTKAECLAWIKEVWTDMRPLSLRKKMAEDAVKGS
jgi:MbtH protein